MGIEGEQLVFDYLSRVGDLAHGTGLSASQRASLVNRLRDEIGRERSAAGGAESRHQVRRILGKMGRPEDVVAAAAAAPVPPAAPAARALPPMPAQRAAPEVPVGPAPMPPMGGPVLAKGPDTFWPDGQIGRFVGGIEIPEMLRPPSETQEEAAPAARPEPAAEPTPKEAAPAKRRRWRPAPSPGGKRVGGLIELLAVLLLLGGTVMGSVELLAIGWLAAYWSPRLSRREAQWATFGMPSLVAGSYVLWLAGRAGGYWGAALAEGEAEEALADHWPWLLRAAALASAAFLLYRARRPRPQG